MSSVMEEKENIGNIKDAGGCSTYEKTSSGTPYDEGSNENESSESSTSSSPGIAEALRPSKQTSKQPLPQVADRTQPTSRQRLQRQHQLAISPIDADLLMVSPPPPRDPDRKKSMTPTTPANSEFIRSAFRQAEVTLDDEVREVKILAASVGTSAKKAKRPCFAERADSGDVAAYAAYATSPESDVDRSPVPPSFPPMPPTGGGVSRSPKWEASRSPKRSPTRTAAKTPMEYSSLSQMPMMAASPLPNKSLLPVLAALEEEHRSNDSGGDSAGGEESNGETLMENANEENEAVETGEANDEESAEEGSNVKNEDEESDGTNLPVKEIEFCRTDVGSFDLTPMSKQSKQETDGDDDDAPDSIIESPLQPMDLYGDDGDGNETAESENQAPPPTHRRRIIDEKSSESEDDEEEESTSKESVGDGMEENAVEGSEGDEDEKEALDFSKLDLNDDDSNDESAASCKDGGADEDDESVPLDDMPSKARRRRITDDEGHDEIAISETSGVSEEGSCATRKSTTESQPSGAFLGGEFAGLTIDESGDPEEGADDPSFRGGEDDASSVDSNDGSSISGEGDDAEVEEDGGESLTCFDGCGCWALDEANPGDLYLSNNSDVRWPGIRLPLPLYNKLFQHQRIGVQWMASLHRNEIKGGILADDMGMGKTMQVLSYLGSLMRARTISNAIVVCPKSVVRNWEREANLILKNMCVENASIVAVTSDMNKERRKRVFTDAFCSSARMPHLVITTYGLVSNSITVLNNIAGTFNEFHWGYVILDEGHLIKNRKTKTSQDMRILSRSKKTRRVLLTGTPIQNNMRELHALFDWATSSKLLGSIQTFLNKYGDPIEEGRQRNASNWTIKKAAEMNVKLKKTLAPYFLQRLKKTTFEDELPEKKELVVFTQLSSMQRRMYEDFTASVFDEGMSPLAAVSWLKMLCGHPSLIKEASGRYKNCDAELLVRDSSKLQVLLALLTRLKRSGHRALVFSQSTKMLNIIEEVLDGSVSYLRIDGSTAQNLRQKSVDHFNDSESEIDIMLLSTKAAGTGLTLTGADRAIIYDPSWNPAEDAQAVDRCYRIGQTKNVTVYRFIAAGSVEEKMYEKQVHKDGIKRVVLSSDSSTARYFDQSELADLFKLAPPGECSMMKKFNEKSNNNASGSSGKPSFLSKHPLVVGVASHDILYSTVSVDVDLTSPRSAEETPFSRSPFQKAKLGKKHSSLAEVEDLTVDNPLIGKGVKPLGGHNQTRQLREDAKAKRNEENTNKHLPPAFVSDVLSQVDVFITENASSDAELAKGYAKAMSVLLDLVENKIDSIKGDKKLAVHEKISQVANILGWL